MKLKGKVAVPTTTNRDRCTLLKCTVAVALLIASCGKNQDGTRASVSIGQTKVKLGHEINLRVEHAPDGWSGEVNVDNVRSFPIDANHNTLRVTRRNGFDRSGGTNLFVMLMDRDGREIPLANNGRLKIEAVPTAISLKPPADKHGSGEGSGAIWVEAASGYEWDVKGLPQWLKITAGGRGSGSGTVTYTLEANRSVGQRSAEIEIGDAVFEITQMAPASPALPFSKPSSLEQLDGGQEIPPAKSELPEATVTLDRNVVKYGEEVQIRTEKVPQDWSGEMLVNSLRDFEFGSKLYRLKATVQNGFNEEGPTELYILLKDSKRREIPLANRGRFRITVMPGAVKVDRESRNVDATGVTGEISVTAGAGYHWSVSGAPDWIRITSGAQGSGNSTVSYTVDKNTTNEARSATLTIGDATFEISQSRPATIQLPYYDNFHYNTPPAPIWAQVRKRKILEPPEGWLIDEPFGKHSAFSMTAEGPKGGNSVVIEKQADPRIWSTLMVLPAISVKEGETYKLSTWMKTQNPGPVTIAFGQRSAPYGPCGLSHTFWVSKDWAAYAVPFRVSGINCDAANNRLSFEVGQIGGKLWIANFSIVPGSEGSRAVRITPESRKVESGGASGRISVTASSGYRWSLGQVPGWIKITSPAQGSGNGTVSYRVDENTTNEARSAMLTLGDATIEISQPCPSAIQLPYSDNFRYSTPPPPVWTLGLKSSSIESPARWIVDEQPGQHSALSIAAEAPKGGNSVLVEKQADPRPWATQVILHSIGVKVGEKYKMSVWMKSQNPGPVSILFGQMSAPYQSCGLMQTFTVTKDWAEYAFPFRVAGNRCEPANNRMSIEAGQIGGKLWIANFSMIPSP